MITPGWYNLNAKRAYPLIESAVDLPQQLLVDAGFMILPQSEFATGTHKVRLVSIADVGGVSIRFTFACDAPVLERNNYTILFEVHIATEPNTVIRSGADALNDEEPATPCEVPMWTGFIVVGDLSYLDGYLDLNETITFDNHEVEPTTIQNLADSFISGFTIANKDRTLTQASPACPLIDWSGRPDYWVLNRCVTGSIQFAPGYGVKILQTDRINQIQFGISVAEGFPRSCTEIPLHPDEPQPEWSIYRDGSIACHETVRSIGGGTGPNLVFSSRQGVSVSTVEAENRVIIDVNFSGLIVCPTEVEYV